MNAIASHILVPLDHPSLAGHFPGHPIVPGVVLLDAVLETIRGAHDRTLRLVSILSAKFLRAVEPGMRIDLQITFAEDAPGRWQARFVGRHAGAPVLEGRILLARIADGEGP